MGELSSCYSNDAGPGLRAIPIQDSEPRNRRSVQLLKILSLCHLITVYSLNCSASAIQPICPLPVATIAINLIECSFLNTTYLYSEHLSYY